MDTIDLAALADVLPDTHKRLQGLIRNALFAYSARSDLRIASDHASRAVEFTADPPDLQEKAVEDIVMALTVSAVIFYARATKSKSDHRSTFDLRPDFDADERAEHEYLCNLRDDAVAHYGPGPISEKLSLRSDHIMLPPPWTNLVLVSRHLYSSVEFGSRLAKQAARAAILMQRIFEQKEADLVAALNECADDDIVQDAVEKARRASLGDALGDDRVAQSILDMPRVGHFRLTSRGKSSAT